MDEKEKIRERYKGVDSDKTFVIPAKPKPSIYDDSVNRRVAVYARVSTDNINQTSSYELQKNHYTDLINRNPNWTLVDIYADEGISGTSLSHRDQFLRMIEDCKAGKIDLIITKSVSRFARNIVDCIAYIRELKALSNPVNIIFESEGINTIDDKNEMAISFLATLAQEESHIKSNIMNSSIEMRFNRGLYLVSPLLGYDLDENKNLVINEDEAKTVKLIFYMYLAGSTCQQIADTLEEYGRRTKKGNTKWSPSSILQILQNERECGDIISRKTWTPNYLDHKAKKNRGDKPQYGMKGHHEGIISRDDFIAVQKLIRNAKYKNKGFLPELRVITDGTLKGFVTVNPRWSAFTADDYFQASSNVNNSIEKTLNQIEVQKGDIDFRNFEVASTLLFNTKQPYMTITKDYVQFNTECIKKLNKVLYVEFLVNPTFKLFALKPSTKESRNAIQWSKIQKNTPVPKTIRGAAYIGTLFDIFGLNLGNRYRVRGYMGKLEELFVFNMTETEIFLPQDNEEMPEDIEIFTNKKNIVAYPQRWADSFGNDYYRQGQAKEIQILSKKNNKSEDDYIYKTEELNVTSADELENHIETLKTNMMQECKDAE